ncbi:MAG: lamin tail domain-containing protein [Akkermansiaceae bacterium]|nr:lamin tail domain-containing protein [Akkermansiaceae bacterium]
MKSNPPLAGRMFRILCSLSVFAGFASVSELFAAPVSIGDPSFEGNSLNAGGFTYNLGPEWQETNGPNNGNGFEEFVSGFTAAGTDHLGMELGHDVWQNLSVTYQANTRYTLTVAVGMRTSAQSFVGNLSTYSLADSTGTIRASASWDAGANLAASTFGDAPALVFDTPNDPSAVGKTIRILLQARGVGRSHFDNIRLDAVSLIPPGAATIALLPATLVGSNSLTLNGQVNQIGTAAPAVTFFWGPTDGGIQPGSWANNITLPGTQTGAFSTTISGLSPMSITYFSVRATNSAGTSWVTPAAQVQTLPLAPTITTGAATQIQPTSAQLAATVTSTGGEPPAVTIYYGPSDGGTNPSAWASSLALGVSSGNASNIARGLVQGTPYFFRAFAQNTGGGVWSPNSGTFSTLTVTVPEIVNQAATGITGTTATLRGEVTSDGNNAPAITVFYGTSDGGTIPANWASSAAVGTDSGSFTRFVAGLSPNTPYFFRCRAVNLAGTSWAPTSETFTTSALINSTPVINEIHYHPADDAIQGPLPLEFIELHNPGDSTVSLAGWTISNAVTYTFPAGVNLAPGGFVVVAQNPATLLSKYGITAYGPWVGKLSNTGETIELRNAANASIDTVSYGTGYPWPTAADGAGPSCELIHPSLDNDLGGSWRSSGGAGIPSAIYISPSSTGWKFRNGTAEASSPVTAWRDLAFNDATWSTTATSVGYGSEYSPTVTLTGMRNNYRSIYFRRPFTIASSLPTQLTLRLRYDDGYVAWINGVEVSRNNAPAGQVPFNVTSGTSLQDHPASAWETITINTVIDGVNILRGGDNVLCVHALNQSRGSSDFYFDAELAFDGSSATNIPTPGAANARRLVASKVPPQSRQVNHSPAQPMAGQAVTITARITDPDGMGNVTLSYQTVNPGSYIPLNTVSDSTRLQVSNPTYLNSWTTVPMYDNGTNGDLVAGDFNYTAVLPSSLQTHRRLVRYKLNLADALGNTQTVPYTDDEQPNFAYFVYNGLPSWTGAFRPTSFGSHSATPAVTYPASTIGSLPPYHLIASAGDVTNSQYTSFYNGVRFRGTLVYNGVVYDHIEFKNRGIGSTYVAGKNKWNIFFNRSRDFYPLNNWGRKYAEGWNNLILNANASPWAPVNRGSAGIEEAASARIYELAGNTNFRTHYVHLRVIDEATEASPTDQFTGDLWGLYLAIEPTEGNFLDERNLPDGNIYAIEGNNGDKKHQGEGQPVNSSDWTAFRDALNSSGQTEAWYRANLDLDKLYTFLALNRLIGNVDVRPGDNYRFYHRVSDNKWEILGYDFDMQFIPAHHWGGNMDGTVVAGQPSSVLAIMRHPALAREFRNRCRELMDLLASDGSSNGGQVGQLLKEYAAMIHPPGETATWANLDAAMWNLHPRTSSNHRGNFFLANMTDGRGGLGGTVATGSWIRTLADPNGDGFADFNARTDWFINFATNTYPSNAAPWVRKATNSAGSGTDTDVNRQRGYGYKYLEWESRYGGYANANVEPSIAPHLDFPSKPVLTATGNAAFPVNDLTFASSAFSDPQGSGTFSAWQWRIAEISAPGIPGHVAGSPCKYEIETLASSGDLTNPPSTFKIPLGVAKPGKTYRVRVRHKDTTGNWSHWSSPAQFLATTAQLDLIHYWNFNNPTNLLTPSQSSGVSALAVTGEGVSGTGQDFAAINARNSDVAGSHLRVNNPLTPGTQLNLAIPTTGFENIVVQYESRRSGQGAGTQNVSYTLDGTNFINFSQLTIADSAPAIHILDFSAVTGANNNSKFGIRIQFSQGLGGIGGNNRFDNLTVEGNALPLTGYDAWKLSQFPNPADFANEAISGPNANPSGDGIVNLIRYAHGVGPYDPVMSLLPNLIKAGGGFVYRIRYDNSLPGISWRVVASNNMTDWRRVLFDSETSTIPPLEDGWLSVTIPAYLGLGPNADPRIFTRLEIQKTTP